MVLDVIWFVVCGIEYDLVRSTFGGQYRAKRGGVGRGWGGRWLDVKEVFSGKRGCFLVNQGVFQ